MLSPELQSRMLECTSDGIYALDPGGRCIWSNPAAARILGYGSPQAYIGRQMHEVIHHTRPDGTPYPESECSGLRQFRSGEGVIQPQELLWRADGTSFWAEVRVNAMVVEGALIGGVVSFRDLTDRLRLEEQYRQAQKMEAVGRLAAGIAHDFNNLLTVINGYTELLMQQAQGSKLASKRLRRIAHAGARAAELTRQLLAFSRPSVLQPAWLQLNDILHSSEDMLRRLVGEDVEFSVALGPGLPLLQADAGQLEQIILNLVVNARDAMPQGGRLRLRSAALELKSAAARSFGVQAGRYVRLEVSDNGIGMDEETRRRMFEPFFTTKPPSRGTGLGLAMVLQAVERAGGGIKAASALGKGTTIQICWPAQRAAPATAAAALASAASSATGP